ncbi:MAG: 2-amino-4-hydroxy-6-hydroxymethyldihydropteridine diphosphokinase [Gemmatimonadaceae bacterium]|nr:2-amino-4-hydroxy-6-hydroxymethyldihydropteridine diphosphokinase [Gemmatimonadaceae bacterium]
MTATVYIALGSNLGDKSANLLAARAAIAAIMETRIVAHTSVEETEPIGPVHQPTYLNQMLAVETSLSPEQLLSELHVIERQCGRERRERWGPRTLDLDIVKFGEQVVNTSSLTIPHPEIPNREFWKRQIAELETVLGE